jgi:DNA-binding NarL/FixJ family response regulator
MAGLSLMTVISRATVWNFRAQRQPKLLDIERRRPAQPMNAPKRSLKELREVRRHHLRLDLPVLTKRQQQVAQLRSAGLSLQAIAKRLGV